MGAKRRAGPQIAFWRDGSRVRGCRRAKVLGRMHVMWEAGAAPEIPAAPQGPPAAAARSCHRESKPHLSPAQRKAIRGEKSKTTTNNTTLSAIDRPPSSSSRGSEPFFVGGGRCSNYVSRSLVNPVSGQRLALGTRAHSSRPLAPPHPMMRRNLSDRALSSVAGCAQNFGT